MDWFITFGLMACILAGGTLSALKTSKQLTSEEPEFRRGQQSMQIGFSWMLSAIVPFWRNHPELGLLSLFVGFITLFSGCIRLYKLGKERARIARLAKSAEETIADKDIPFQTGKAAAKRKRRAARKEKYS